MTKPTTRPATNGVKMLITAVSVAAVVGGWAAFTLQESGAVDVDPADTANSTRPEVVQLPPLPTLVPTPSGLLLTNSGNPALPPLAGAPNPALAPVASNPSIAPLPSSAPVAARSVEPRTVPKKTAAEKSGGGGGGSSRGAANTRSSK
jgi:hypothetical protein